MRRAPLRSLRGGWDSSCAVGWIGRSITASDIPLDEQVANSALTYQSHELTQPRTCGPS